MSILSISIAACSRSIDCDYLLIDGRDALKIDPVTARANSDPSIASLLLLLEFDTFSSSIPNSAPPLWSSSLQNLSQLVIPSQSEPLQKNQHISTPLLDPSFLLLTWTQTEEQSYSKLIHWEGFPRLPIYDISSILHSQLQRDKKRGTYGRGLEAVNPQTTCKIPNDIVPSEMDLKAALERSISPLSDS